MRRTANTTGGGVDEALRVAGRLVALAGMALTVVFVLGILLKPLLPAGLPPGRDGRIMLLLLVAIGLSVAHLGVTVLLERTRWEPAGLGAAAWHPLTLVGAFAVGVAVIALSTSALMWLGWASLEPTVLSAWRPYATEVVVLISVVTLTEALAFRGYFQGLLAERWGVSATVTVPALCSAAYHVSGQGATWAEWVAAFALGAFLGAVRQRTGSVVAAWLSHVAIAWTQVAVLHTPVPGMEVPPSAMYRVVLGEPAIWTGGVWGVEGGLMAAALLGLAALVLARTPGRTRVPSSTRGSG